MSSLNPLGTPFIELPSVESTNNYAMGLARAAMAQHGTSVFAHEQTRGKGQRDREWISQGGRNIALSLVIEPKGLDSSRLFLLSMAIATGVHHFFRAYVADDIKIKWPNDIYWRDRKAAGILIENLWQGEEWKFAIAGIGINVNQTDFDVLGSKAVSLKQITGRDFEPIILAKQLCNDIDRYFNELLIDPEKIIEEYRQNLYKRSSGLYRKKRATILFRLISGKYPKP